MAKAVTDSSFKEEVIDFKGVAVVDFWATWCGPCRVQGPIIDGLAEKFQSESNIKFLKLDVDDNPATAQSFNVMSIPTLIMFKNGEIADIMVGLRDESELEAKVNSLKS